MVKTRRVRRQSRRCSRGKTRGKTVKKGGMMKLKLTNANKDKMLEEARKVATPGKMPVFY